MKTQLISCANTVTVHAVNVLMQVKTVHHVKMSVVLCTSFTILTTRISVCKCVLMASTVRNPTTSACHVMKDANFVQDPQMTHVQNVSQQQ